MVNTKLPTRWIETSDGYIPAPDSQQPTGILHKQVLDTVDEFKISSFDAWAMGLFVTVGSRCNPVTWECEPDPTKFKFEFDWSGSRNRTLATRFHKNQVQVCLNTKWTSLTNYLKEESKCDPTNPNRCQHLSPENKRESIAKVQRDWWSRNKKHFPLFELPAELRNEIYRYAAPQDAIEPYSLHRMRGYDMPFISYRNDMVSNLLKCNKVVAREMRSYMFAHLPLLINHQRLLKKTLRENLFFPRDELTHLTLAFRCHKEFLDLFGLRARSTITGDIIDVLGSEHTPLALCRDRLRSIKRLEIVIPSRETLNNVSYLARGCQTNTATMLLEIMEPFIKGHPLVISGMIKQWQKRLWEAKAAQAHKEYEEMMADSDDEGGVPVTDEDIARYEDNKDEEDKSDSEDCSNCGKSDCERYGDVSDSDDDEEVEEEFEYHLPFICQCRPRCLEGGWTDADHVKDRKGASDYEFASDFESDGEPSA